MGWRREIGLVVIEVTHFLVNIPQLLLLILLSRMAMCTRIIIRYYRVAFIALIRDILLESGDIIHVSMRCDVQVALI